MNPEAGLIGMKWAKFKARVDHIIHPHKKENIHNPEIVFQKGDILVVRHAQSGNNVDWQALVQHPKLTEKGKAQAKAMGKLLKKNKVKFDLVVTSGSTRAEQTAVIIMQELEQTVPMVVERNFRERNVGVNIDKLGEKAREVQEKFSQWKHSLSDDVRWDAVPNNVKGLDLSNFETERQTAERFQKALRKLQEEHPGKSILVISHAYTMTAGLAALSQAIPDSQGSVFQHVSNTGYFTVRSKHIVGENTSFQIVHSNTKETQVFEKGK